MKSSYRDSLIKLANGKLFKDMTKEELESIYKIVKRRDRIFLDSFFGSPYEEINIETLLKTLLYHLKRR